jgi:hypothetical protein
MHPASVDGKVAQMTDPATPLRTVRIKVKRIVERIKWKNGLGYGTVVIVHADDDDD